MTVFDARTSDYAIDMEDEEMLTYVSIDRSLPMDDTQFAWTTAAGHTVYVTGTGFTYDSSGRISGGIADHIEIDM